MTTEKGWAIVGKYGLYTGWHMNRRHMIAQHVSEIYSGNHGFGELPIFCLGNHLNNEQKRAWELCQKNGDRAVKVKLTYT